MNGLAEHSSVCFIGNPFSVYFSTRCTAFTAAGGIKTLREYADQDRRPPPRRRQPGLANMPGHADDDARFHDQQQAYVHARGIAPIHLKPELTIAGSRRSGSAGGGAS